jgi:hypothetical protein
LGGTVAAYGVTANPPETVRALPPRTGGSRPSQTGCRQPSARGRGCAAALIHNWKASRREVRQYILTTNGTKEKPNKDNGNTWVKTKKQNVDLPRFLGQWVKPFLAYYSHRRSIIQRRMYSLPVLFFTLSIVFVFIRVFITPFLRSGVTERKDCMRRYRDEQLRLFSWSMFLLCFFLVLFLP